MKLEPMHKGLLKATSPEFPNLAYHNGRLYASNAYCTWSLPAKRGTEGQRIDAASLAQALKAVLSSEYPVEISAEGVLTSAQGDLKGAVMPAQEERIDLINALNGLQLMPVERKVTLSLESLQVLVAVMAGVKEEYITLHLGAYNTDPIEAVGEELKGIIMPCKE